MPESRSECARTHPRVDLENTPPASRWHRLAQAQRRLTDLWAHASPLSSGGDNALPMEVARRSPTPVLWMIALAIAAPGRSAAATGEVTLTTAEYQKLRLDARSRTEARSQARSESERGTVSAGVVEFRLSAAETGARFEAEFDVHCDSDGWNELEISRAALGSAEVTPAGQAYFTVANGTSILRVPGRGSWRVRIASDLDATFGEDGRRTYSTTLPLLPIEHGRVEIPETDVEIQLGGGSLLGRSEAKGLTRLELAGAAGAQLMLEIRPRTRLERELAAPLAVEATLISRSRIAGGELITDVEIRLTPKSGRLEELTLETPREARVLYLRGPGLGPWRAEGRHVVADRLLPSPEPLTAELRYLMPVPNEHSIELPTTRLLTPGKGDLYLSFEAPPDTLPVELTTGGFEPVEPEQLTGRLADLASGAAAVLRASTTAPPAAPRYDLHRMESAAVLSAQIRQADSRTYVAGNGRFLTRLELEVVSSTKPFVTLDLPPDLRVVGAESQGRPILAAAPEAGRIALPLASTRGEPSRVAVLLAGEIRWPIGGGRIQLPKLPFDIPIGFATWSLELPDRWSARLAAGSPWSDGEFSRTTLEAAHEAPPADVFANAIRAALDEGADQIPRRPVIPTLPANRNGLRASTQLPGSALPALAFEIESENPKEVWQ